MNSKLIGKFVVVRTYSAGVHAGILEEKDGKEVRLTSAYRIWYWDIPKKGTGSLSAVAEFGCGPKSKIAGPVAMIELTEAIEIIAASEESQNSIVAGKWES